MAWTDQLVRGLLCLAVSFEDCTLTGTEVANLGDDKDAIYGTDDSSNGTTFMVDSGASAHCC